MWLENVLDLLWIKMVNDKVFLSFVAILEFERRKKRPAGEGRMKTTTFIKELVLPHQDSEVQLVASC